MSSGVWPLIIMMLAYHLNESGQRWNALFLFLFLVSQLIDVGVFAAEGRIAEATCAFVGSKMAGDILLPSVGLLQHVLLVMFPPLPPPRPLSSYRFLSVTTHMFVLVSSLHSTACGQGKNEVVQALIYASILVYTVSLPAKVGGLFFVTFLSCSALLWRLCAIVDARAPAIIRPVIYEGGAYCYLYAAVFLCEARFSAWVDAAVSDDTKDEVSLPHGPPLEFHNEAPDEPVVQERVVPVAVDPPFLPTLLPCRYPVISKAEQIATQRAQAQHHLQQERGEAGETEVRDERPACKFPVIRKQPPR